MRGAAWLVVSMVSLSAVAPAGASAQRGGGFGPPSVVVGQAEGLIAAAGDAGGHQLVVARRLATAGFGSVLVQRAPGGAWRAPVDLPAPPRAEPIGLAAAGDGAAVVAWSAAAPKVFGTLDALVRAPGGGFVAVRVAGPRWNGVRYPAAAVDARGGAIVAFLCETHDAHLNRYGRVCVATRPAGSDRFTVRAVSARRAFAPVVAAGPGGEALVAWTRARRAEVVSVVDGRPGRVRDLGPARARHPPFVAVGRGGSAVVAWVSLISGGPVERFGLRVAARSGRGALVEQTARRAEVYLFRTPRAAAIGSDGRFTVAFVEQDGRRGARVRRQRLRVASGRAGGRVAVSGALDGSPASRGSLVTMRRGFALLWRARSRSGAVTWRLTELDGAGRIDGQGDGPVFARRSATALGAALVSAGSGSPGCGTSRAWAR